MPELPEVEHARGVVLRALKDRPITHAESNDPIVVAQGSESFARALVGAHVVGSERRGKSVLVHLARGDEALGLFFHLGMTGHFVVRAIDDASEAPRFARWTVTTDTTRLTLVDGRRLGRAIAGPRADVKVSSGMPKLGPDAIEVRTGEQLARCFRGKSGKLPIAPIKLALMDQAKIAGLGNIHAAEAVFFAKIHPDTPTSSLRDKDWDALVAGVDRTLSRQLAELAATEEYVYVNEGGPNPFSVYGKEGEPCPVCGKAIETIDQGGRTTYFCSKCQKKKKA
ncbi:MAG: formamidopyrimidine-DNA glycosylase [Deltaproteobacteria bacterium]|nr:formamidopyrimidine-DNA glycosylase [Deltaproteobacteria bacterium]